MRILIKMLQSSLYSYSHDDVAVVFSQRPHNLRKFGSMTVSTPVPLASPSIDLGIPTAAQAQLPLTTPQTQEALYSTYTSSVNYSLLISLILL